MFSVTIGKMRNIPRLFNGVEVYQIAIVAIIALLANTIDISKWVCGVTSSDSYPQEQILLHL